PNRRAALLVLLVWGLFLCCFLGKNSAMYTADLFSGIYYAWGMHSLGALCMWGYAFMLTAIVIYKYVTLSASTRRNGAKLFAILFLLHLFYFFIFYFLYNTTLNASVSVFPTLPLHTLKGENTLLLKILFSLSLVNLLFSLHLIFDKFFQECRRITSSRRQWWLLVGATSGSALIFSATIIWFFSSPENHFLYFIGVGVYLLFLWMTCRHVRSRKTRVSLRYYAVTCLLSTFLLSILVDQVNGKRLAISKESFAHSLLVNGDPLVRYNMAEISRQVMQDAVLSNMLSNPAVKRDEVSNYLEEQYIQPYFENNRHQLYVGRTFVASDLVRIRQYQQLFEKSQRDTLSPQLCMLRESLSGRKYLMLQTIPLTQDTFFIALEVTDHSDFFKPTYLPSRKEHRLENELLMFSCAEYQRDILTSCMDRRAVFKSRFSDYALDTLYNGMSFVMEGNQYSVYCQTPEKIIVLSSPYRPLGGVLRLFAYLFTMLGVYSIAVSFIIHVRPLYSLMFRQRVQLLIAVIVILVFSASMTLFILFAFRFSQTEMNQNAIQRMNLIVRLLPTEQLSVDSSGIAYLDHHLVTALYRLPKDYVENVNLYTLQGESVVSNDRNRPALQRFERLDPHVMEEIVWNHKTFYIDKSYKGDFYTIVLYQALRNKKGDLVAYLGYPTRQRGGYVESLFASIIPTFFGIYLLLTILFVLFGSLFSNYVVRSLTKIAQLLSKVNLKSENQKIKWKYEDEIGLLVQDYNRLVDDLALSAEMLARSSKESAWKELAQQVAHEIKNPLTPMKLRTQQLQKLMREERLTKEDVDAYTHMMIGQIDALTEITSSFSSLAKLHHGSGKEEDLLEIMRCALETYEDSDDYQYLLEYDQNLRQAPVWTDRQQMLRVFNNLIKNAMQAKKNGVRQRIILSLSDFDEKQWQVLVTDFGCGMDAEAQKMAFIPHFTTKSSGSGLGLAIVRNIITDWGGSIRFESVLDEYTVFTIRLPKYIRGVTAEN
ncbi:MAG: HAMP domain-containing histidine kinase, partial [Bacteroidales bacterium]|nr:HAMP domain-containing histidine kinase [Bacteroidales bacterium]